MTDEKKGDGIELAETAHVFDRAETELLRDLENQKGITRSREKSSLSVCVKIQKVPDSIKLKGGKDYYTPSVISIGPIHSGNKKLEKRDLKLRLAAKFVENSGKSKERLIGLVQTDLDEIKKCYEASEFKPFHYENGLSSLFFLDACFVLEFIHGTVWGGLKEFEISKGLQNSINQDLFLLENQLPLRLLKILINCSAKKVELEESIFTFMDINAISPMKSKFKRSVRDWLSFVEKKKPVHLLDLLRWQLLHPLFRDSVPLKQRRSNFQKQPRSFRNVQDLKTAGIKIKPIVKSFRVSFSTWWFLKATLRVPPLVVDSLTVLKLLNLVAYEMCPDNYNCDFKVSSYLYLMDWLVDTEQDVSDLRAAHVLHNHFSSDEEVAKLFNDIGSNLVINDKYIDVVSEKVQKHYVSKLAQWWAQFCQNYFSSPWKVLALIGGVLVLLFGGVSAYYAMFPRQAGK